MDLENRISLLEELGKYMHSADPLWIGAKEMAYRHNPWFTPAFIDLAVDNIVNRFLQRELLEKWISSYHFPSLQNNPKQVGIVMAGNIPLVGFHDFLSVFISGHRQLIKLSSKDQELLPVLLRFLHNEFPETRNNIQVSSMLKNCDAYIATGSNNTARYFDYYFCKYPNLIRRNRTSAAVLNGTETGADLENLADDVHLYFGLGCRNVTKIWVPEQYDFQPLLSAFGKYRWLADHNRYKNNFDYQLSLAILNKRFYMCNDSILLMEEESPFSPISVLHYSFYNSKSQLIPYFRPDDIQCMVGKGLLPFGQCQRPGLTDYADGADTLQFLRNL